jgi:Universal stress protein UspA and related nucleotide-binding proteins
MKRGAMPEFSDDMLVEFALGLRDDREIKEAVEGSPELRTRLRALESELRCLEGGLDGILAEAALGSALPCGGWRILLAIDDSQGAKRAAATADVLVRMAGGEVEVLHVRETAQGKAGLLSPETRAEAVALVTDVVSRLREGGVIALGEIQPAPLGQIAARILAEAEAQQASLIVMSSRPMSGISAALCGSVSRGVLKHATCPVLIVR